VAALERAAPARVEAEEPGPVLPAATVSGLDLALAGRSVLVMAGAFLLRALANLDAVPDGLGVALGLAYALAILGLADRVAARGRPVGAAWFAAASLLIAYPLLAEAVLRFRILDAWTGAAAAVVWFAAITLVAARQRAAALAWIAAIGAPIAGVALAFATRAPAPHAWALMAIAAATFWLGPRLGQRWLVLPAALAGDLLVLAQLPVFFAGKEAPGIAAAPLCAFAWFLLFTVTPQGRAGEATIGDHVQAVLALAIGLGGGLLMAPVPLGAAGLAVAIAGSVAAARRLEGARLWFWSSLWLAAGLAGLVALSRGAPLALACAAAGLALALLGPRRAHALAGLHAAILLALAALASGLLAAAWRGLAGPAPLVALAAMGAATLALRRDPVFRALLALLVFSAAGALSAAGIALAGGGGATIRTGALALAAIACAASRSPGARFLVYPILLAGAAKLLVEDLFAGGATVQFAGLAIYGVALIVAPRWSRSGKSGTMRWKM
jgi:hypothetical protein